MSNDPEIKNKILTDTSIVMEVSPERIGINLPLILNKHLTQKQICKMLDELYPIICEKIEEKLNEPREIKINVECA